MRGILPVIVGAVLGALVVTILLGDRLADEPSLGATTAAQRAALSASTSAFATADPDLAAADAAVTPDDIAAMADPVARRRAALALLDDDGLDAAAIERIAASLPPTEAVNFRIDAIVKLAASDTDGAFAAVMTLPDREQRRLALSRLASALAGTDPLAAIAAVAQIDAPDLETEFVAALLDAWAVLDPASVFGYLESADASVVLAGEATLAALAASDPERLLAMANDFRRDVASLATTAALETLIDRDPESALSRIAALPPGADRAGLERTAAELYGEQNPSAAWEWASGAGIDAYSRIAVVRGIHQVDPEMAWDLMLSQLTSTDSRVRGGARENVMNYIHAVANSDSPEEIVAGLDRLLGLNDSFVDSQMQTNIWAWADRDPEAALDWSLRNLDRFDETRLLSNLSAGLARTNVDLARETIYRLDEAHRTAWAAGVARALAESDVAAARSWAYELPRGPLRDAGLSELIAGEAHGGTVDRQLFEQFSSDRTRGDAARAAALRFACDGRTEAALEIARAYITDERMLDSTVGQIDGSAGPVSIGPLQCQFMR